MSDQNLSVSSAFATTPINPNVIPSNQSPAPSNEQPALGNSQTSQTPQPPQTAQPPQPSANGDADVNSVLAMLNSPADAGGQSVTPPSEPAPASGVSTPQPPYQVPPQSPEAWQQQQQMLQYQQQLQTLQQQNAALQQQVQTQDTTINNLLENQKDYDTLKQQSTVNDIDFGELSTVDVEDAKKITSGIMKALSGPLTAIQQALQQQQQYTSQSNQWQEQRFVQQQAYNTFEKIRAAHPDVTQLQKDPAFQQFLNQRDGYSFQTRDARAAFEFSNGNAEYIIELVNQFKQQRPQQNSITTVAPVQTATSVVQENNKPISMPSLATWNSWYQTHRITQEQYQQGLKKIRDQQR